MLKRPPFNVHAVMSSGARGRICSKGLHLTSMLSCLVEQEVAYAQKASI